MLEQAGDEDAAAKVFNHRWRRWVSPKPRNMNSNRASQMQDPEPDVEEPDGFPGLLSAEETDNSSQIEVNPTKSVLNTKNTVNSESCQGIWQQRC